MSARTLDADYVVVGAGSAGAALAARLSEDPTVSVLLLEAGPSDRAVELHIPAAFSKLFRGRYDWNYDTVPQPALEGRTVYWPRELGELEVLLRWVRGGGRTPDLGTGLRTPLLAPVRGLNNSCCRVSTRGARPGNTAQPARKPSRLQELFR